MLAALLGVIPKARRHGLRLLVTPDMILRSHRDIALDRGCRRELLDRTLIWNQVHLRRVLRDYETH